MNTKVYICIIYIHIYIYAKEILLTYTNIVIEQKNIRKKKTNGYN